jgi:hypothetical protein
MKLFKILRLVYGLVARQNFTLFSLNLFKRIIAITLVPAVASENKTHARVSYI